MGRQTVILLSVLIAVGAGSLLARSQTSEGSGTDVLKPQLDWIPEGKLEWHTGWMNGYARGLDLVLQHLGHDVDYVSIMGDTGLAFIMQGEENSPNRPEGAVNVGWWPLEPLGMIRLNFLEQVIGRQIRDLKLPLYPGKLDPAATYEKWFEPSVVSSVENDKPFLARVGTAWYIVTGFDDDGDSPLIGMCTNTQAGREEIDRIVEPMPPYAAFAIGEAIPKIDRKAADLEALRFTVALHRDQVLGPDAAYGGEHALRRSDEYGKHWRTGLKSFSSWIACLEDTQHLGRNYWHSNVVQHLRWNRTTAIRYLEAMQQRHPESIASHLGNAAAKYQDVLGELKNVDTGWEAISSAQGREKLISSIRKISGLEGQAVAELDKAVSALE